MIRIGESLYSAAYLVAVLERGYVVEIAGGGSLSCVPGVSGAETSCTLTPSDWVEAARAGLEAAARKADLVRGLGTTPSR